MNADLRWLDLDRNDLSDRVRWKSLVELEVRQKPATRSGHGRERWTKLYASLLTQEISSRYFSLESLHQ